VSSFLADHSDDPHTAAAVVRSVKGVEKQICQALVALSDEGYARVTTKGARRFYRHVRPYTSDEPATLTATAPPGAPTAA